MPGIVTINGLRSNRPFWRCYKPPLSIAAQHLTRTALSHPGTMMTEAIATPSRSEASVAGIGALTLGSLGVVYGDIGTSPLYALREAVSAASGTAGVTEPAVLGVLSLILWALVLIVTVKYVLILLRADNNAEGGTLALMALAQRALLRAGAGIFMLGIISAALFYGDAVITPAISVLSAIEGLKV